MTDVAQKSWKQTPGWVKLLLVVSLIGNASVIGLIGGNMFNDRRWKAEPGLTRHETRILMMVPENRKEEARAILRQQSGGVVDIEQAIGKTQGEIVAALRAEPFDAPRLLAAMRAGRAAWSSSAAAGDQELADIAAILTPAERGQMADAMQARFDRWADRRKAK